MRKKFFALALGLTMTFSASAMAAGNGDANGDGEVNIVDASTVLQYANGLTSSVPNRENADVNGDGFIDKADANGILNIIRNGKIFEQYNKVATQKTLAYANYQLNQRRGNEWVDAGDNVTVLQEYENAYLVRYPVRNGTKERWVNKNEIFAGNPTPNPIPSGDYESKARTFINNSNYRHGAKASDCFAYASKFTGYVFGKAPRQGQVFYSADQIKNGDVVHVNAANGRRQHWIVILHRNGNRLETIEGGWTNGTVRHSDSAYWIQDGVIYSSSEGRFRAWDCGYHFQ